MVRLLRQTHCFVLAFLLFLCALLVTSEFHPTKAELRRAVLVSPSKSWGQLAREQNSLRVLCLGGSNTVYGAAKDDYVSILNMFIKTNITRYRSFRNSSWALSEGISGQGPQSFIGKKYPFESQNISLWPNVILFEFAVNIPEFEVGTNRTLINLERLMRLLRYKYSQNSAPQPDFVFFNLLHMRALHRASFQLKTTKERQDFIAGYHSLPNIAHTESEIVRFASFYDIPVISFGTAVLPAAKRHFLSSNESFSSVPWSYLVDAVHISRPFATTYAVERLLGPFFKRAIKSRVNITTAAINDSVRLLPAAPVLNEIKYYSTYGRYAKMAELSDLIVKQQQRENSISSSSSSSSQWTLTDFPKVSLCFGSYSAGSVGLLHLPIPRECDSLLCRLGLTFLHSWNASVIGDAECVLHRLTSTAAGSESGAALSRLLIRGQEQVGRYTFNIQSYFDVSLTSGNYSITCTNLRQDRLSCLNFISVWYEIVV